jgi:hypothetical protein
VFYDRFLINVRSRMSRPSAANPSTTSGFLGGSGDRCYCITVTVFYG